MFQGKRFGTVTNIDEITLQVNESGRSNTSTSYQWLLRGGNPERPTVVYRYDPARSGSVPREYLGEYRGYIQTDGYAGYLTLGESEGIIHVGCMAHIRRKFVDVQKTASKKVMHGSAKEILDLIALLYKVEHNIKELEPSHTLRGMRIARAR